jgi:hypothetical protein
MTEQEWLACIDPMPLLNFLRGRASNRQLRLFALACCHRCRRFITDPRSAAALDFAERHAERGVARVRGRREIAAAAHGAYADLRDRVQGADPVRFAEALVAIGGSLAARRLVTLGDDRHAADAVSESLASSVAFERALRDPRGGPLKWDPAAVGPEKAAQVELLRDILGSLFRPVSVSPACLTPPVVALAQAAYDQREMPAGTLDVARLAVLADALEEAGCTDSNLLGHLRGPGPHVRGCWAVDLLLGKS